MIGRLHRLIQCNFPTFGGAFQFLADPGVDRINSAELAGRILQRADVQDRLQRDTAVWRVSVQQITPQVVLQGTLWKAKCVHMLRCTCALTCQLWSFRTRTRVGWQTPVRAETKTIRIEL